MKATCPANPEHQEFFTTAHVAQTWRVDAQGNFLSELSSDDVTHGPDSGNTWTCATCGKRAEVEQ